ncbi:MAG: hypothetical protein P8Y27_13285 [Chromatiaceae bacterium]
MHENRLGKTSTHELDHTRARRRHSARASTIGVSVTSRATAISIATPARRSRRPSER